MRYYVYASSPKIEMLYSQIPSALTQKLAGEVKLSVGVISATLKSDVEDRHADFAKLQVVEKYLEREGRVGTVAQPGTYVHDVLTLRSGVLEDYAAGLAFFGGQTEGTTLALIGSSESVVGARVTGQETHSINYYELKFIGEALEGLEGDPSDASDEKRYHSAAVEAARIALREIKGRAQRYEFLARILYDAEEDGKRIIVATPVYVAFLDTGEVAPALRNDWRHKLREVISTAFGRSSPSASRPPRSTAGRLGE